MGLRLGSVLGPRLPGLGTFTTETRLDGVNDGGLNGERTRAPALGAERDVDLLSRSGTSRRARPASAARLSLFLLPVPPPDAGARRPVADDRVRLAGLWLQRHAPPVGIRL